MDFEERTLRIATLLSAHIIFLSAAALRILRGQRSHRLRSGGPWWLDYYPPLVWIPFVVAYVWPIDIPLAPGLRLVGLLLAAAGASFAAWGMWSLGKSYGIRSDLFDGHALVTSGVYSIVRHPMYFGIVLFHAGASLSLASALLLAATVLCVVPYTALRIRYEERVLDTGFPGRYAEYARRVPPLVPFVR